jgi:flavin reductase (DIM6/NTAB) family NADH-FMN oxidoreductase RutF
MSLRPIAFDDLQVRFHHLWDKGWLLLTAGDFAAGHYNAMTVGWGSLGTMWRKPFAQVVVRPVRYTYEFMNRYETFTLCAFPAECRKALELLGSRSGRSGDKIRAAGLTPVAASVVPAPAFAEASLVLECRKVYWQDLDPSHFLDPEIDGLYPNRDYHRVYFGEIVAIRAASMAPDCTA